MTKTLLSLAASSLLLSLSLPATALQTYGGDSTVARAERPEKPQKPEKREKLGALDGELILAREASERPRGRDNERPGDRQRRGGRA
ncbi:MAG: hypothetical protein KA603_01810 [Azonexus sp.]|jgi:hypothetical protein|nr:hypothetical protein [Betaproteobacteria bacterium]MBK8919614.1 hypothetical protein [Betaproteobacteria bacterium]MBP6034855.1 hypothetical protein [Azonexus sp.]MBP6905561.1 hypothetical protein [Azonexus sp.]